MIPRALGLVLLVPAAACSFWDPLDQPGLRVVLSPLDTALYIGDSFMAQGEMLNTYGDTYPSADIHYVGLDSSASVTRGGKVTGRSYGRARVIAVREHLADTGVVTVVPTGLLALSSYSSVDIRNIDGSGRDSVVSVQQGFGEAAAWVPGRDSLVYAVGIPGGAGAADLHVTDLAGNHRLSAASARDPRVSQDRAWVYFSGAGPIERAHLDGSGREVVVAAGIGVAHPDPSPDGTHLAFIRLRFPVDGGFQIQIRTLSDSTERTLTSDGMRPRWSPDGGRIAFMKGDPAGAAIYVVDADGGNMHQVSLAGRTYAAQTLDWSPDGQWLVARGANAMELIQVSTGLSLPLGYAANYRAAAWRW